MSPTCEDAVITELVELRFRETEYLRRDGRVAADELFFAEQNALVVRSAEEYYRMSSAANCRPGISATAT